MFDGKVDISKLDHDSIKESFKAYLASKEEFKDINFDGSNINSLMSFLAYHTYYNAFYESMTFNESFLDTAQKRSSVISRAKELNYIPHGKRSAKARISVEIPINEFFKTEASYVKIPKNTRWTGYNYQKQKYQFLNREEVLLFKIMNQDGSFVLKSDEFDIYNGSVFSYEYTYDPSQSYYEIPNISIDDSSIAVYVRNSKTSGEYRKFIQSKNSVVSFDTDVFYVQQNNKMQYEIYFGDGVYGSKLYSGNYIYIEYLITDGDLANECIKFELNATVLDKNENLKITVIENSFGGTADEDIESVRRNAPLSYQSQGRAVVASDFYPAVKQIYPNTKSISVWGGEENSPPLYGKVIIAVLPSGFPFLTSTERDHIKTELMRNYGVVGITPIIMNPDYNDVLMDVDVEILSSSYPSHQQFMFEIKKSVVDYINNVNAEFNVVVSDSQIVALVHGISSSIKHCTVRKSIKKKIIPTIGKLTNYEYWFEMPIVAGSLTSTWFFVPEYNVSVKMYDGRDGKIYMVDKAGATTATSIGYVDYETGYVSIPSFIYADIAEKDPGIIVTPLLDNIRFKHNNVAVLNDKNIIVNFREIE